MSTISDLCAIVHLKRVIPGDVDREKESYKLQPQAPKYNNRGRQFIHSALGTTTTRVCKPKLIQQRSRSRSSSRKRRCIGRQSTVIAFPLPAKVQQRIVVGNGDSEQHELYCSARLSTIEQHLTFLENRLRRVFGQNYESFHEIRQWPSEDDAATEGQFEYAVKIEKRLSWMEKQLERISGKSYEAIVEQLLTTECQSPG